MMEEWHKDQNFNPPSCPSCGVPYKDHAGLNFTCNQLQRTKSAIKIIEILSDSDESPEIILKDIKEFCQTIYPLIQVRCE